jgi:hypothetical protein
MKLKKNSTTFLKNPSTYKRPVHSILPKVMEQTHASEANNRSSGYGMKVTDSILGSETANND